jgi:hypothetical protein
MLAANRKAANEKDVDLRRKKVVPERNRFASLINAFTSGTWSGVAKGGGVVIGEITISGVLADGDTYESQQSPFPRTASSA